MALSKDIIRQAYPLPVFNYRVAIDADVIACAEVSGLGLEYEKVVYKHGLSFLTGPRIIRTEPNIVNISLKRGVVAKRAEFWNWLEDASRKTVVIDLCDEAGTAVVRWKADKALPLKITAPGFAAATNDVAFESLDIVAPALSVEYL